MSAAPPFSSLGRLFVLGSGFSASLDLPTLQTLFPVLMDQPDADSVDLSRVTGALSRLYPHFAAPHILVVSDPALAYPPFEEFLGLVMAGEETPPFDPQWWASARRSALRLLTDCLWSKTVRAESSPKAAALLRPFVERLQLGDVAITFNWDTLLERELRRQGKPVLLNGHTLEAVTVLKLHGSLSWVKLPNGNAIAPSNPLVALSEEDRVYADSDHNYSSPWTAFDEPPFIVPPIAAKRPSAEAFLSRLWRDAFRALWGARTIAVIGYSAPPEDLQARALLTSMFSMRALADPERGRYVLVDPNPAVAARYFSQISPHVTYHQTYFTAGTLNQLFEETIA